MFRWKTCVCLLAGSIMAPVLRKSHRQSQPWCFLCHASPLGSRSGTFSATHSAQTFPTVLFGDRLHAVLPWTRLLHRKHQWTSVRYNRRRTGEASVRSVRRDDTQINSLIVACRFLPTDVHVFFFSSNEARPRRGIYSRD